MTDRERPVNASGAWDAYIALVQQSALHAEAMAESLALDTTALRCIGFISSEPGMTPGRLADLTGLTTGAVTGVLDRLERGGFIERSADPSDRRRTLIRVSHQSGPVGHAYDQLAAAIEGVAGRLDKAERARLVETLDRMREAVASDVARLRAALWTGSLRPRSTPIGCA